MTLRVSISDASPQGEGVWSARLAPADVRRLGESRVSFGRRSVVATTGAVFTDATQELSVAPSATTVLNIGTTDHTLIIELGDSGDVAEAADVPDGDGGVGHRKAFARGDTAFLAECRRLMPPHLADVAEQLLNAVRQEFPGEMDEGQARKWVNYPHNFFALTIQPRDASFAIHIKGRPNQFAASSLEIKEDRSSYSRFKLNHESQLSDAISVVMKSGRRDDGPKPPSPQPSKTYRRF